MTSLSGKVVLVTGAASGIGRASARAIAQAGAQVVVSDINPSGADETVAEIHEQGGEAWAVCGDVADTGFVSSLIKECVARFGRLDGAHNNAGIETPISRLHESSELEWDRCMSVNLKGVWLCMREELRQMLAQGGGAVVNTASVGGLVAVPGSAAYSAAKHGVVGLSKTAAVEYARDRIRVNALCPGLTHTGMTERLIKSSPDLIQSVLPPMQRIAGPEEIAGAVVFLLSDAASYLSGQAIAVDGAATAV